MLFNREELPNEVPFESNQFNEAELNGVGELNDRNFCHQGMHHMQGCMPTPIIEPVRVHCVERNFVHNVPHICPVHTKIINNHVYQHTFTPRHTCSEENRVQHIKSGSCEPFGC